MPAVTLNDGREVDSTAPEWRAECLRRDGQIRQLLALRGQHNKGRRAFILEEIERLEGAQAADRVREQVRRQWSAAG